MGWRFIWIGGPASCCSGIVRRIAWIWLAAAIAASLSATAGCHRRRPRDGMCAAHIDCDPGYDCVARRCRKREAAPGATPEAPIVVPTPAPAPEPAPGEPNPPSAPGQPASAPRPPRPAPDNSPGIDNAPAPPPSNIPMWKARLKNS